jgi:hypothetical protein
MPPMADDTSAGWAWFATDQAPADPDTKDRELCRAFAHCFAGGDGRMVLEHLKRMILERRLPPNASDAELRHLEGQRHAVAYVVAMVERGCA